jgi:hypothetical protein
MIENWEKVLTTPLPFRAELAKALLAEHEIEAVVVNRKSSSYPTFGSVDVYVPAEHSIIAKLLISSELTDISPGESE